MFPLHCRSEIFGRQEVPGELGGGENHPALDWGCTADGPNSPTEDVARVKELMHH